jgi:hypothetical protein
MTQRCLFCGEAEHVAIHEVWGHEFMMETCCLSLYEHLVSEMDADPAWARHLLRTLEIEELCGPTLRRVADTGCGAMLLDWQLRIGPGLGYAQTRAFIDRHHGHCAPPKAWRFDAAIYNGFTLLGVAVVGNPVAPAFMGKGILEVNRLCLRRDLPDALLWNAASMLYGWCAREAKRRGWCKIITYTRADEPGTSLTAAGWEKDGTVRRGRGWHSSRRPRSNTNAWVGKVRWAKTLWRGPLPQVAKARPAISLSGAAAGAPGLHHSLCRKGSASGRDLPASDWQLQPRLRPGSF